MIASGYDRKIADIRENASVTYCVDAYSEDWDNGLAQVIVSGEAYLIESGPEFERDRGLLYEKFPQYERSRRSRRARRVIIEFRVVACTATASEAQPVAAKKSSTRRMCATWPLHRVRVVPLP